jgi:uncharacterized membrane protein
MITLISAWSLSYVFAFVFMCRKDVQTLFTSTENAVAKCVNTFAVGYSHSISDFITDALIILIPIPFVSVRTYSKHDDSINSFPGMETSLAARS